MWEDICGLIDQAINSEETSCPDVRLVELKPRPGKRKSQWCYAVKADSQEISEGAKRGGEAIAGHPEYLLFTISERNRADNIIWYELQKYAVRKDLPEASLAEMRDSAALGAELHPWYYGEIPAPYITPRGYTMRYLRLTGSMFWLETDQNETLLAVTRLLWADDMRKRVQALAEFNEFDRAAEGECLLGYAFFSGDAAALALFELKRLHSELRECEQFREKALENVVIRAWPDYTEKFNRMAQGYKWTLLTRHPEAGETFIIF